jgi:prepilin-type processing-associated H-X9-DG protein
VFVPAAAGNTKFAGILDGTSNTAAASERVKGIGNYPATIFDTMKPTSSFVGNKPASMGASGTTPQQAYQTCFAVSPTAANVTTGSGVDPLNGFWMDAEPSQELYNHVMPPNTWSCSTDQTNYHGAAISASSRHSGVVNLLLMDGSVRAVKNSVAMTTWWALGTKANNEVIDASSF